MKNPSNTFLRELLHNPVTEMTTSKFSAATDTGLRRGNNEDSYLCLPELGLWIVADGMGGHEAGEVASAIVVDSIRSQLLDGASLAEAIQGAHRAVQEAAKAGIGTLGMGSTVVALLSKDDHYEVAWVGDSRAYLWSPHTAQLQRLSTDHSYVQMLLESGAIAEHEAATHPDKNVITQCIGSADTEEVVVDSVEGNWEEGQWILLCSDGLTDELDDEAIADILAAARSPRDAVNQLISQSLAHGGHDNITVQVVESPRVSAPSGKLHCIQQLFGKKTCLFGLMGLAALFFWTFLHH